MKDEEDAGEVVDFGWEDEEAKPLGGRRLKAHKEKKTKTRPGTFDAMGFSPWLLRAVKRKGFRLPTPIQRKVIPRILQGLDVIGMARTGSGKTAAFVLPMLQRLQAHSPRAGARALVLSPTRELALQTHKVVREMSKGSDLRTAVLVGGDAMEAQFAELAANPDILVATPGRLLHHLTEVEGMNLQSIEYCVCDEADRLFEMGFAEQVGELLSKMREGRQLLLFSATLPRRLADFASARLNSPQLVRLDAERRLSPDLSLAFFTVRADDKPAALLWLLRECLPKEQQTIVFASTRHHVDFLHQLLLREGVDNAAVYGAMDQAARKINVAKFRAQRVRVLVVTDVAARGIDIPLLDNVVNYDFTPKPELFVHRAGRAARMGRPGSAMSLLTRDEVPYLLDLHLFLGRPVGLAPEAPDAAAVAAAAGAAGAGAGAADDPLLGAFPPALLEPLAAHVRDVVAASADLSSVQRSLANAFGLYLRTRPPASSESVKRARRLGAPGPHPLLLSRLAGQGGAGVLETEAALAAFARRLREFRPAATVLEAEIARVRPTTGGPTMATEREAAMVFKSNDVMSKKRKAHAAIIERTRQRAAEAGGGGVEGSAAGGGEGSDDCGSGGGGGEAKRRKRGGEAAAGASGGSDSGGAKGAAIAAMAIGDGVLAEGRFRDSSFYVSHSRQGRTHSEELGLGEGGELAEAVLELGAEDTDAMRQQQRQWQWDARKRRYVQRSGKDAKAAKPGTKRVLTESGKRVEAGKHPGGIYKKWVKANKTRVAAVGTMEEAPVDADVANRFKPGMRHRSWKAKGAAPARRGAAPAGGELKSREQVASERRKKAALQERMRERQEANAARRKSSDKRQGRKQGKGRH